MLTGSAITLLRDYGSDELRDRYLEKLVTARWTGTMVLTEPQAGSDLGAIRTSATPNDDGSYRLNGSKIFITWGDHDLAENIIHLVLGIGHVAWVPMVYWLWTRLDLAPEGSLFRYWLLATIVLGSLSLLIDAADVIRYLRGERSPTLETVKR